MRIFENLYGFYLYLNKAKRFDFQRKFKGKRIAVIGAANSTFEKELGKFIDDFDIVIRINKALITYKDNQEKFIGRKTDFLIHNFHENLDDGGGGPLDWKVFDSFSLKYLVQAKSDFSGKRNVFNYYKKYKSASREVLVLPSIWYQKAKKLFVSFTPTRGFMGIFLALNSEAKEVYLTGFTFFKTAYADGYRDNIKSVDETLKHIDRQGFHDAEFEFQNFLQVLTNSKIEKILLDDALYRIVQNEEQRISKSILKSNVKNIASLFK